MGRYAAWLGGAALAVAAVVVAALAILVARVDRQEMAATLRQDAAAALDAPVAIGAVARGRLWPPQLILRDVRVGEPDRPPRLAAEAITIEAATLPFARRELAVRQIRLDGLTVDMGRWASQLAERPVASEAASAGGNGAATSSDAATGSGGAPAWLAELQTVEASDVTLRTHAGGWQWQLAHAVLDAPHLADGPASLKVVAGDGANAGRLTATLARDGAKLQAEPLTWQAGDSKLAGSATLKRGDDVPQLTMDLAGPRLAVSRVRPDRAPPYEAAEAGRDGRENADAQGGHRPEGTAALPWDALARGEAEIEVRADKLVPPHGPAARDAALAVALADERLEVAKLAAQWPGGGKLAVTGSAQRREEGDGTAALSINAADVPLASLAQPLAPSPDRGRASIAAQLAASGASPRDLLASAQGTITADLQEARLPTRSVAALPAPWASVAAPWFTGEQGGLACAAFALELDGSGRAVLPAAMASTPRADILATGELGLVARDLAVQLMPSARAGAAGRPLLPLRIAGPWQAPEVGVANLALADRTARELAQGAAKQRNQLAITADDRDGPKPCRSAVARLRAAPPLSERLAELERRLEAAMAEADGELGVRLEALADRAQALQESLAERGRALERELTPLWQDLQERLKEEGKRLQEDLDDTF